MAFGWWGAAKYRPGWQTRTSGSRWPGLCGGLDGWWPGGAGGQGRAVQPRRDVTCVLASDGWSRAGH